MTRPLRVVAAAAVVAAVAGSSAWALHTTPEVHVMTAAVTSGAITRRVVATGTVQAVSTVEIGSQVSGIVQALDADYNSVVHTGQVVARLDPSSYAAQLRAAQAALAEAHATVANAQASVAMFKVQLAGDAQSLDRARALAATSLIPQSDLDAAEISVRSAEADEESAEAIAQSAQAGVVQARAAMDQASVNLDHTIIRSPINGIVIERSVDVGQTLAASVQSPVLFRVAADLRHVQVQVDVDEADVGGLSPGEPVTFEVESYPEVMFSGTLSQVRLQPIADQTTMATTIATATSPSASTAVATVVSYIAVVDVANPDDRLRPGMTAEVALRGARRDGVVRIPNSALSFRPPADVLQVLGEGEMPPRAAAPDDTASRQVWRFDGTDLTPIIVRTGLADDGWTELLSGPVQAGDALVTGAVVERRSRI